MPDCKLYTALLYLEIEGKVSSLCKHYAVHRHCAKITNKTEKTFQRKISIRHEDKLGQFHYGNLIPIRWLHDVLKNAVLENYKKLSNKTIFSASGLS